MNLACVILAAGLGKRMRSSLPKVLHSICGIPMIQSVLNTVTTLRPQRIIVVAGKHMDRIQESVEAGDVLFAHQAEPRGTGHALRCAAPALKGFRGDVLVVNGDTPLIRTRTLREFLRLHQKNRNILSVLSFIPRNPAGYGRIVRSSDGEIVSVVEQKDADIRQKKITEANSGVYAISHAALSLVEKIPLNRARGEYYLTDIVAGAVRERLRSAAYCIGTEEEFMGVNTRAELHRAAQLMRKGIVAGWTAKGVDFIDSGSAFIDAGVSLSRDVTIYPHVCIEGRTRIGSGSTVFPNVRIRDARIGRDVTIKDSSVIEDSVVEDGASVGPFAHIRPGSRIGRLAKIGNFVELKKASVGDSSKASHLSYLGDTDIGKGVNIGAGTITCNYDGSKKHRTVIRDGVFIGSDSQLVAPVIIGEKAYIGAGSTITKDVPAGALALSRSPQKIINGWVGTKGRRTEKKR
ncbi:MAG: bifunctional UDP-N-acetylglucosamine diphosphorylase/glucosamine-1-phosphate N-acetyltransferase GlmU [Nitrospirae bacterium]|nr:bifunctional UDP-N-acetylglucosamine diphosphorylase/glucosamine-1-phosphate N-acetyltransferase GlmU [Nitrospirota bacterium]